MRQHRIFIAINLPDDIKAKLVKAAQRFNFLPARWVREQGIHLTLLFVGYLDNNQLVDLIKLLEPIGSKFQPFQLKLTSLRLAPKPDAPRYLWADLEAPQELSQLYQIVKSTLENQLPIKKDHYRFHPHLTLSRIKDFRYKPEPNQPTEVAINLTVPVNSFEVMESFLQKGGAEYQIAKSYPLGE